MAQDQPSDSNQPKPLEAELEEEGMIVEDLRDIQLDARRHTRFLGVRRIIYSSYTGFLTRSDSDSDRDWDWK